MFIFACVESEKSWSLTVICRNKETVRIVNTPGVAGAGGTIPNFFRGWWFLDALCNNKTKIIFKIFKIDFDPPPPYQGSESLQKTNIKS